MIPAEVHLVLQNMHRLNILLIFISLSFIKKNHGHNMIQHKNFMDFWTLILNTRVLKKAFPLLEIGSYLHLALQNQTENCHQMYPDLRDKNKQNSFIFL